MTKSSGRSLSRRELFGVFRTAAAPEPTPPVSPVEEPPRSGFSLDAFYAGRQADAALAPFAVKPAATPIATTRVGLGRTVGWSSRELETTGEAIGAFDVAPGVAQPVAPAMVPRVLPKRCLATTSFCSVCVERCPVEGAIVVELGRPRVDAARCDGCGRCIAACPAPILAFELVSRDYPP